VRDIALFLRLLSERVYSARLASGGRVLDASDFHQWLVECSALADRCDTVEQFFNRL
jgi:hypothetical protein